MPRAVRDRDGEPARCTLYFGLGDIHTAEFLIAQKLHPETGEPLEDEQRLARQQLRQVVDYAESSACRRAVQLRYFGEEYRAFVEGGPSYARKMSGAGKAAAAAATTGIAALAASAAAGTVPPLPAKGTP